MAAEGNGGSAKETMIFRVFNFFYKMSFAPVFGRFGSFAFFHMYVLHNTSSHAMDGQKF